MVRLDAVVRRRSRLVVLLWLAALAAAVPFAVRQAEHLQSGRFDIPGSQAEVVGRAVDRDYPQLSRSPLAAVIVPDRAAAPADSQAALGRLEAAVRALPGAMELLGRWNWWLPAPLARLLERLSLEPVSVPTPAPVTAR